jgi:hypothetical protein
MPNTLTNVKDIKVAQSALAPWMHSLLPLRAFSSNFSPAPADKLDTIRVPLIGAPSGSSDFAGDYTANADSTVTVVPVVLNKHKYKYKTVHMTARENIETALPLLENLVGSAIRQLAYDVLQDIFSEITAANYGAPVVPAFAATALDYAKVISIREGCATVKMPPEMRSLIFDDAYFSNLLKDEVVSKSFILPLAQPGVIEARINRIAGFDMYETTVLPDNGENLVGMAAHPSGLAVAMRYLTPVAKYDEAGAVTDPQTGLTFGYLRHTDTRANKVYITVECLYGIKVARADGIRRIVSA